jgi:hypothetical protein
VLVQEHPDQQRRPFRRSLPSRRTHRRAGAPGPAPGRDARSVRPL